MPRKDPSNVKMKEEVHKNKKLVQYIDKCPMVYYLNIGDDANQKKEDLARLAVSMVVKGKWLEIVITINFVPYIA